MYRNNSLKVNDDRFESFNNIFHPIFGYFCIKNVVYFIFRKLEFISKFCKRSGKIVRFQIIYSFKYSLIILEKFKY